MFEQENLKLTLLAYKPEELSSEPAYKNDVREISGGADGEEYYKSFSDVMTSYMSNVHQMVEKEGGAELTLTDLDGFYVDDDDVADMETAHMALPSNLSQNQAPAPTCERRKSVTFDENVEERIIDPRPANILDLMDAEDEDESEDEHPTFDYDEY